MAAPGVRPRLLTALAVVSALALVYSVIIAQQLLFGFVLVFGVWVFYLLYLLVVALLRIANAVERLADQGQQPNR